MYSLLELANLIGGTLEGEIKEVKGLAGFENATKDHLTFAGDEKYLKKLGTVNADAIIVPNIDGLPKGKTYIKVTKSPRELMPLILKFFKPKLKAMKNSIEDSAKVGKNVQIAVNTYIGHDVTIGDNVTIMPNVTIMEGSKVGDNTVIYPGVTLREFTTIGNNCILNPGACIGSDGFGFVKINNENHKIEQIGKVIIEDNCEIGANSTIDRGALDDTIIKKGTKLDNLVHIAHNVIVGEQCLLTGQVGVAGSTTIGNHCTFGGQTGISGHIHLGDNITAGAKSGITKNLKSNQLVSGFPAIDHSLDVKAKIAFKKLPDLIKRVNKLEKLLNKKG